MLRVCPIHDVNVAFNVAPAIHAEVFERPHGKQLLGVLAFGNADFNYRAVESFAL